MNGHQTTSYAAVVLYYRRGPDISKTIESIWEQSTPPTEVIVVDNASGDGVLTEFDGLWDRTKVVTLQRNQGYAGGMNAGRKELSQTPGFVLFVTHEVVLDQSCVGTILQGYHDHPFAIAGPALKLLGTGEVWSTGGLVDWSGNVSHTGRESDPQQHDVEWLDGSCLLAQTVQFDDVGGFDEDFFLYWEDVDLCSRIRNRGRVVCDSRARAAQSTGTAPIYYRERNRILFWRKNRRWRMVSIALLEGMTRLMARDLIRRDLEAATARIAGLVDGISGRLRTTHATVREAERP